MRSRMQSLSFTIMLALIFASPLQAGEIAVTGAWIRALPPSLPSGGYFTLHNGTDRLVTLTGADSPACGMLMLHKSENRGGIGSMEHATSVKIPAGDTVRFAPGGYHLMCTDAGPAIKAGNRVDVTLQFAGSPVITTTFTVKSAAGT